MAKLSINVALAKLGEPDFSLTQKELDAWEMVRFDVGQGGTPVALKVAQVAKCNYVTDCTIDVPVGVTYRIASELQANISNAQTKAEQNAHRQILMRVKWHAARHYTRVVELVIPPWKAEISKDLDKTLPSDVATTTEDEGVIRDRLAPLVSYWVEELGFRIEQEVNLWEQTDYPPARLLLGGGAGISHRTGGQPVGADRLSTLGDILAEPPGDSRVPAQRLSHPQIPAEGPVAPEDHLPRVPGQEALMVEFRQAITPFPSRNSFLRTRTASSSPNR